MSRFRLEYGNASAKPSAKTMNPLSIVNSILKPFDIKISRASTANRWQMPSLISRLGHSDLRFESIIDVGAASGSWTQIAHKEFPNAKILAIEPIQQNYQLLKSNAHTLGNVSTCQAVVGRVDGTDVAFTITKDLDGSGVDLHGGVQYSLPTRSLDSLKDEHQLPPPYFLKLDTHGYEVPILEGASQTLKDCSAVLIEAYNFKISSHSIYFWELCEWMQRQGSGQQTLPIPLPAVLIRLFGSLIFFFCLQTAAVFPQTNTNKRVFVHKSSSLYQVQP
jgi:FkbM family methyltransferase